MSVEDPRAVSSDPPGGTIPASVGESDVARGDASEALLAVVHRCIDALVDGAVLDDNGAPTWPTWVVDKDGSPVGVAGGRSPLYDGDAGVVWALTHLGVALGREDASAMALRGREMLITRDCVPAANAPRGTDALGELGLPMREDAGLLCGRSGIDFACGITSGLGWSQGCDLTDGLAGILLQLTRARRARSEEVTLHASRIIAELGARSRVEQWGRSWPDLRAVGDAARPLCGMAHGASGVAWALGEAAMRWPRLRRSALALADDALAWESSWADPVRGGWPDLREGEISWPDLWCHGSVGAGAVRLRLIQLAARGLPTPWSSDWMNADAEAAVQRSGQALEDAVAMALRFGPATVPGGWTLCHGLAGPASLLALAARVWREPIHLDQAQQAALAYVGALPESPGEWPSGIRGADGDFGLMTGVAGTAMQLAELALPAAIGPVVLLEDSGDGLDRASARASTDPMTWRG